MTQRLRTAEERRAEIQANAKALGIDEAYISLLVDTFYLKVREHERLGPIFNNVISDWEPHLANMKQFWSSVALNTGLYSGRPVPKHVGLKNVTRDDFKIWLSLFEETLQETAPTKGTPAYFMERAERIAASLQFAMFGDPTMPWHVAKK